MYEKPKRGGGGTYIPHPPAVLESARDREIWLDIVAAAIHGFAGTMWQDNNGMRPNTAKTAAASAVEAADIIFEQYQDRLGDKVEDPGTIGK